MQFPIPIIRAIFLLLSYYCIMYQNNCMRARLVVPWPMVAPWLPGAVTCYPATRWDCDMALLKIGKQTVFNCKHRIRVIKITLTNTTFTQFSAYKLEKLSSHIVHAIHQGFNLASVVRSDTTRRGIERIGSLKGPLHGDISHIVQSENNSFYQSYSPHRRIRNTS